MTPLKHVGKVKKTGAKVVVVFRTLPGESNSALVLPVALLSDSYHDALMKAVESNEGQDAFEFGEIMFTRSFPDGRPMLQAMRADGMLEKVLTDTVTMTPVPGSEIDLSQLNVLIAEQKNCAVDELCTFVSGAPKRNDTEVQEIATAQEIPTKTESIVTEAKTNTAEVLDDKDIAKSLRSQADALYKEAAKLRKQADELDPIVKKTSKVKETSDA